MTDRYTWLRLEKGRYSAGHHDPNGNWIVASYHKDAREAAEAARVLNGGKPA